MVDARLSTGFPLQCFPNTKMWFAVFTMPRHEKRVEEHFQIRGIESFLPLYEKKSQWKNGLKKVLKLPLFSNYIFVNIDNGSHMPVLTVPGVVSVVGSRREKLPISNSYIETLREGLQHGKIEPHDYLTQGAKVRIRSGAMAGMEGWLLRKKNNCRVVLTLETIMRSISVEVEMNDIEPICHSGSAPSPTLPGYSVCPST